MISLFSVYLRRLWIVWAHKEHIPLDLLSKTSDAPGAPWKARLKAWEVSSYLLLLDHFMSSCVSLDRGMLNLFNWFTLLVVVLY